MTSLKPASFNFITRHQGKIEAHQITTEFLDALKSPEFLLNPLNNPIWREIQTYPKTGLYPLQGGLSAKNGNNFKISH